MKASWRLFEGFLGFWRLFRGFWRVKISVCVFFGVLPNGFSRHNVPKNYMSPQEASKKPIKPSQNPKKPLKSPKKPSKSLQKALKSLQEASKSLQNEGKVKKVTSGVLSTGRRISGKKTPKNVQKMRKNTILACCTKKCEKTPYWSAARFSKKSIFWVPCRGRKKSKKCQKHTISKVPQKFLWVRKLNFS